MTFYCIQPLEQWTRLSLFLPRLGSLTHAKQWNETENIKKQRREGEKL